ncbi:hypothetical protein [Terrisporobacter glycolicus]|uniref:hypothetical protein n=1 Tax=Terrisporobacter glycolicus TaxID=36841 RepID=UPI0034645485
MKIGIVDADLIDNGTRHPNLALMKIAGFYRDNGHEIRLITSYEQINDYDVIYMSKVFTFTKVPEEVLKMNNIHIGGTGFFEDGGTNLPDEIEHHMPYYDLYKEYIETEIAKGKKRQKFSDYLDYSIGFTTRGCFRKCAFCVNKKYDHVFRHSPVEEFFDKSRPYIYLWDDNILAFPQWREVITELGKTGRQFQFRQGIDLRLMTDEKSKVLNKVHYQGDFIFAFDHVEDKAIISEKVQLWRRYSSRVCKMYVLSGFDSQDEKDIESVFERISILMKYGSLPYIMRYEDYKNSRFRGMYVELARWCNQPQFFKKKSFREFCEANQFYKKNQETNCAAYQTMLDFEAEFPEIAEKYYDLKFEKKNIYRKQYGYGRKYANKLECNYCKKKGYCWSTLVKERKDIEILKLYFSKEIDLLCLEYDNAECGITVHEAGRYLLELLKRTSVDEIISLLHEIEVKEDVTQENIPQYSKLEDAYIHVPQILKQFKNRNVSFEDIGYYLEKEDNPDAKTKIALKKYGENHTKLACLLDLAHISKNGVKSKIYITKLGEFFIDLSDKEKRDLVAKLSLRIPIIQNRFIERKDIDTINRDFEILSEKTQKRRGSNVLKMVKLIVEYSNIYSMKDFI